MTIFYIITSFLWLSKHHKRSFEFIAVFIPFSCTIFITMKQRNLRTNNLQWHLSFRMCHKGDLNLTPCMKLQWTELKHIVLSTWNNNIFQGEDFYTETASTALRHSHFFLKECRTKLNVVQHYRGGGGGIHNSQCTRIMTGFNDCQSWEEYSHNWHLRRYINCESSDLPHDSVCN